MENNDLSLFLAISKKQKLQQSTFLPTPPCCFFFFFLRCKSCILTAARIESATLRQDIVRVCVSHSVARWRQSNSMELCGLHASDSPPVTCLARGRRVMLPDSTQSGDNKPVSG